MKPSKDEVMKLYSYNPETGIFSWVVGRAAMKAGDQAGGRCCRGYIGLMIGGRRYLAHVVAWLLMTGQWPQGRIDHRDANGGNNRWENLRIATQSQNIANSRKRSGATSQYKGVSWKKKLNKWTASIYVRGSYIYLGVFTKEEDAAKAYLAAARLHFGEFARAA